MVKKNQLEEKTFVIGNSRKKNKRLSAAEEEQGSDVSDANSSAYSSISNDKAVATQLNTDAYLALEKVRRLNLYLACQEFDVCEVDYEECPVCFLNAARAGKLSPSMYDDEIILRRPAASVEEDERLTPKFLQLDGFDMHQCSDDDDDDDSQCDNGDHRRHHKHDRCLLCWSPSCLQHSSAAFRRETGITLCLECEQVLQMDFAVDCISLREAHQRQAMLDKLIDLYDHAYVLLQFSKPYLDHIVQSLEASQKQVNRLHVGGSSAGIVSGLLGVAVATGAAVPAVAPPLLIASLLFGTGATAVPLGTELQSKFFSQPHHLADRILTLHGMMLSVLSVAHALRNVALRDQEKSQGFLEQSSVMLELRKEHIPRQSLLLQSNRLAYERITQSHSGRQAPVSKVLSSSNNAAVGSWWSNRATFRDARAKSPPPPPERSAKSSLGRNARFLSRTTTTTAALRSVGGMALSVAGGALAGATLFLELQSMANTLVSIRAGSPCEKAQALRDIQEATLVMPTTAQLDKHCQSFLTYMNQRGRILEESEAVELLWQVVKADASSNQPQEEDDEGSDTEQALVSSLL